MITRFYHVCVLRNHQILQEDLWIKDGYVCEPLEAADCEIDGKGCLIAPGFIDIQLNGAFGYDFSSQPEKVVLVARQLPQYGVTSFLPTLISLTPSGYLHCIPLLQPFKNPLHAQHLGIHLEGPFINPIFRGVHSIDALQSDLSQLDAVYGTLQGVKLVTLAPELPNSTACIHELVNQGIIVSAGHTNATNEELKKAIQAGLTGITHAFNAMRPFHHRDPGVIGEILTQSSLFYSIIADGHHLHPTTLQILQTCCPNKLILTTDGVSALGCSTGIFRLGSLKICPQQGVAMLEDTNQLAGGITPLNECLKYFVAHTNCSLVEALEAVSLRPAQLLKLDRQKGQLNPGADADFVLLDRHLEIQSCYLAGQLYIPN